jgi:hypothetical protein
VVDREEIKNGFLLLHKDVYFTDPDGDAISVVNKLISSSLSYSLKITDDVIQASTEEQKGEALVTSTYGCGMKVDFVIESRILDKAGNLSEPATLAISCTAPPVNTKPFLITGLVMGFVLALVLLVGFWLLFRHRPIERLSALQSTLFLFCLLFPLGFMGLILHEGGHALYLLVRGVPITLYVHPFSFSGYARPMIDFSVWTHVLGAAVAIPVSLLISLPFWKRRSLSNLPLVMLFPWVAFQNGTYILTVTGDFRNLMQVTGLPAIVFIGLGACIAGLGIFYLFSLFPLLGLSPQDRKSLIVVPAAMFLWGFLSMIVAHLFVPGSPIDVEYFLAREIISGANEFFMGTIFSTLIAVLYLTLYRRVYPKLPTGLRMETINLTWRDLRLPGLLFVISVFLGLIIVH